MLRSVCDNYTIYKTTTMKFEKQHMGKWVAEINDKIVASDKTLTKLMIKLGPDHNPKKVKFTLVPKGFITG